MLLAECKAGLLPGGRWSSIEQWLLRAAEASPGAVHLPQHAARYTADGDEQLQQLAPPRATDLQLVLRSHWALGSMHEVMGQVSCFAAHAPTTVIRPSFLG